MTDFHSLLYKSRQDTRRTVAHEVFGHPDDVVGDPRLTLYEKRALLASWASDANAVPHVPSLRQLPDGSIVKVDEILRALKALDIRDAATPADGMRTPLWQRPFNRRRGSAPRNWSRYGHGRDDDDDPPPCPAYAARRPRSGGGAACAYPEPVPA